MSSLAVDLPAPAEIQAALSEFAETPGKFSIRRREPAVLFGAIKGILVIASGRGSSPGTEPTLSEQHAACFFVKAALLRDGADHYTLLGLDREDGEAVIKAHYRLMMRLIHPDFSAAASAQWPTDAATRVNRAYKVLSSPVLRSEYDQELGGALSSDDFRPDQIYGARGASENLREDALAKRRAEILRGKLRRFVVFCGLAAVGLIAYIAASFDRGHQVDLVQRNVPNTQQVKNMTDIKKSAVEMDKEKSAAPQMLPGRATAGLAPMPASDQSPVPLQAKVSTLAKSDVVASVPPVPLALQRASKLDLGSKTAAAKSTADVPAEAEGEKVLLVAKEGAIKDPSSLPIKRASSIAQDAGDSRAAITSITTAEPPVLDDPPPPEKQMIRRVTMADAQPLIANLLHQLETGRGNNLLTVMDADARRESSSLAFASYYDGLVAGARRVKLSQVELKPEPAAGRLLVTGFVRLQLGDDTPSTKRLTLRVEFVSRGGAVVMTRLTGTEAADR